MTTTTSFEWRPDDDSFLEGIASADIVESEWTRLRDIIKNKIDKNISLFLSQPPPLPPTNRTISPLTTATGGLKLPPFPPRRRNQVNTLNAIEAPISYMTTDQANEFKDIIFTQLDEFDSNPPFTIQRVCELCIDPTQHYKSVGKYLRAVEKSLLVTSTWDSFPQLTEQYTDLTALTTGPISQTAPSTPLFSPIPFLHDDARRSKSHSPPSSAFSPLTLTAITSIAGGDLDPLEGKVIGLVDELDDPSPGHLSDHPTPLTSVTVITEKADTQPFLESLNQNRQLNVETGQLDGNDILLDDTDEKENKG